jgi:hypothetical protein
MARAAPPFRIKCKPIFTPEEREEFGLEPDEGYTCTGRCTRPIRAARFRKGGQYTHERDREEYAILHPSPKPGYKWQVSWFDDRGPWGDSPVDSCDDGLREVIDHWSRASRDEDGTIRPGFKIEDWAE